MSREAIPAIQRLLEPRLIIQAVKNCLVTNSASFNGLKAG
jgi:hypothetical protein